MKRFVKVMSMVLALIFCLMSVSALASFSVTTTARINLRTAPGTQFASLGIVDKGVTLSVDETGRDSSNVAWYHVSVNGKAGWICSTYTTQGQPVVTGKVYMSGDAYIRKGAGLDYASLGVIKKGTIATYLDASSIDNRGVIWYRISCNGITGWVSGKYATLM